MTGNQILAAYSEIAKNDLFPVLALNSSGIDSAIAMNYINIGAERVMRELRRQAKDTFSWVSWQQSYNIQTVCTTRFFEVESVKVDQSYISRTTIDSEDGYCIIGDTLTFNRDLGSGTVQLVGFIYAQPLTATDTEVTDIPKELHLAVAHYAILESCGTHDTTPEQQVKLAQIAGIADGSIDRIRQREAMNSFPTRLTNGYK